MKKIILFYNPVSGNATFKRRLDEIVEMFQRREILPMLYRTCPGENSDFVKFVCESRADGVVAAGGDGTLHLAANLLKKNKIDLPLGIIGSGTSNDFATHLEIDGGEDYFDVIAGGITRPIDLGLANGKEYFVNVASAGAFTSVAHEVNVRLKNFIGKPAYYLQGIKELPNFKSVPLKITADGKFFETDAFLFLILNSPAVAGLKKVTDKAKIDDGKLDLIVIKKTGAANLIALAKDIFAGKCVRESPEIFYIQAKNFEIDSEIELKGDLDGEQGDSLPLKIETIPNALNFFARL